ncbi:hypothetical protein N9Y17_01705 [Gammaproteobacteria bacterium]|nr:hypothetical protein [Gammaproteobacteria bacterium]
MQNLLRLLFITMIYSPLFAQDITTVHMTNQSKQTMQIQALPASNHCQSDTLKPKLTTRCTIQEYGAIKLTIEKHAGYIAVAVADYTKPAKSDGQIVAQDYLKKLCMNNVLNKHVKHKCWVEDHTIFITIEDAQQSS